MKKLLYLIILLFIVLIYYINYHFVINDLPKNILNLLEYKYINKIDIKLDLLSLIINSYPKDKVINNKVLLNEYNPIIYIYNTHTNEKYSYQKNDLYNINHTVISASYILQEELKKYGIDSIVEENNVTNYINDNNLLYSDSYKVSRKYLENKKIEYPSLIYFIDIHRDSVKRDITTIKLNDITYARTMFLLGLENNNYLNNKKVMESLNNYLDSNYKGLSRGIYEKKGKGVNGIYNQDFNENTMLIEVGGVDNTIDEVSNSIKVIAEMLNNYLNSTKID